MQRVVQEQSSGLRGALSARSSRALAQPGAEQPAEGAAPGNDALAAEATALATRLGPAITGGPGGREVAGVLTYCRCSLGTGQWSGMHESLICALHPVNVGAGEVQRVLQVHLGRVRHDPLVEAFAVRACKRGSQAAAALDMLPCCHARSLHCAHPRTACAPTA